MAVTRTPAYRMRQWHAIDDLLHLRRPLPEVAAALDALVPSPDRTVFLDRHPLGEAIDRFERKELSESELRTWAQTVLRRADIGFASDHEVVIGRIVRRLAGCDFSVLPYVPKPQLLREELGLAAPRWYWRPSLLGWLIAVPATVIGAVTEPEPAMFATSLVFTILVVHAVAFGRSWVRFGNTGALTAVRREALGSLGLCLALMLVVWNA